MKRFYSLLTVLFFGLTFNLSAQETVIAVWDFADNSVAGDINPDFSSALNTDLDYLNGGQTGANAWTNTDVVGGDFDNSYTLSNSSPLASAASGYILNNLNLGPTTATAVAGSGLINNKIHFSLSFKSISLASASDKLLFYLKDANSGTGTNWRQTGFLIQQNTSGEKIEVRSLIYNAGNSAGTQKLCGNFGTGLTLADFTIGVTLDYDSAGDGTNVASIRFWIGSPDNYSSGDGNAWGFKIFNNDGFANTNAFPALTATPTANAAIGLANSVTSFLQFTPNFTTEGSEVVFDQIKISTGEYENTVAAGNTSTPDNGITELYFSKYAEGSSNNKFLEIYNGTDNDIDLSNYAFPNVTNDPTTAGEYENWNTFTAGAIVAAGDVYVIAHPSADASILALADQTHSTLSNGDDGYALVSGTETSYVVIDWLGDFEADPGSGWAVAGITNGTVNHTLTRKSTVCGPNNNWASSAGTNAEDSEWIVGDSDSGWDTIGSYTGCVFDTTAPVITLVGANPQELTVGDAYAELGATATDDTDDDTALTATIVIDASAVDTATAGSYSVTYDVSDAAGNAATQVTRTVTVEAAPAPLLITTSVCATATSVRLTGPWWGWDPAGGPIASDNGDGTWTFTLDPAPTADMEYLLVVDGVQENLIANMANGGDCAPITDYANYANRLWETTAQSINMTDSGLFSTGNNATWNTIFTAVLNSEGVATSGLAQTVVINITDLPDGSTYRIYKTTSTGAADFTQLGDLVMGENTITVPAVEFNRTVKFQFSGSGSIEFDSFSLNSGVLYLGDPTVVNVTNNYGQCGASCVVPVITMTGSDATITVGDVYTDAGATASDDEEGDITANIAVVSTVDTTTAGTYTVTYNVSDGALNAATQVTRTVNVEAAPIACGDTVTHCYTSGTYSIFDSAVDNAGDYITVTINAGETESGYDDLVVYDTSDTSGNVLYSADGDHTGQVIESTTGVISVWISGDGSWNCTDGGGGPYTPLEMVVSCAAPPACEAPTNLSVSGVTTTGATLNWVSDGSQFMIELLPSGVPQGTAGGYVIGDVDPYPLTSVTIPDGSLTSNTSYDFYVVNVCADGNSEYAGPFTFTTPCDVVSGAWSNDFETNTDCWLVSNGGDANGWGLYANATDGGGAFSYGIYYGSTAHDDYLISPAYSVADGVSDRMSFDTRNISTSFVESIDVQIWNADISTMLETVASGVAPGVAFETFSYDLSAYEGQDIRFAFHITTTNEYAIFIDNVVVDAVPDTIAPVITVTAGTDTVEQGSTWTDAGATSDGGETVTVSGTVDISIAGTYTITYTATDAAGNTGTATRTVTVVDTIAPVITVTAGTDTVAQGSIWTDAGATSDGGETVTVSGTVDTSVAGTYTITYTATDAAGNTVTATRTVTVEAAPAPLLITTSVCATATSVRLTGPWWGWDPAGGPVASDNGDGTWTFTLDPAPTADMEYLLIVDGVQENLIANMANGGDCAPITDFFGYANRLWETTAGDITNNYGQCGSSCVVPVITMTGSDETITVGDVYTDAGATASDDEEGDITANIIVVGAVDTTTAGTYTVTYNVSDGALNAATQVTRTVNVSAPADTTAPVITLVGANPQELTVGDAYAELGATATDDTDDDTALTATIVIDASAVDTATAGSYSVTYDVSDAAGNAATQVTRTVNVEAAPIACGDTVTHCYTSGTYSIFDSAVDNAGDYITVTINAGETESGYDDLVVYDTSDTSGNVLYSADGDHTGQVIESTTGVISVWISGDGSWNCTDGGGGPYTPLEMVVSCAAPPACEAPTNLSVSGVTTTGATLNWVSDGSQFMIELLPSGVPQGTAGGYVIGDVDPYPLTSVTIPDGSLTSNTSYDFYVVNVCADGNSEYAGPFTFTTPCDVVSGAWSNDFETNTDCWLVSNGGDANGWGLYANATDGGGAFSYGIYYGSTAHDDYLISPAYSVADGVSDRMSFDTRNISTSFVESIDVQIWNADISTMLETVASGVAPGVAFETFSYDLSAYEGQDIRFAFHITTTNEYAIFIDNVVVDAVPACITPTDLNVSDVTTTGATLNWVSDGSQFMIELLPSGVPQGTAGGYVIGDVDPYPLTSVTIPDGSLTSNTSYDFYVVNVCADGNSEYAGPFTFTTSCDTVTVFPYLHGFEDLACWSNSDSSAAWALDDGSDFGPGSVTEGVSAVFFNDYDYSSGSTSDLMSPNLDLSALTVARLSFDYYDGGGTDTVDVLVDSGSGPVVVYTTDATVSTWTTIEIDLPEYAGQTIQIGFRGSSIYGTSNPHIDNLMVAEAPSCLAPSDLVVSSITTTTASVAWTANNSETAWEYQLVETGVAPEDAGTATVDNPLSLSNLTDNTAYDVYVRANCGTDFSAWSMVTFTTLPAPIVPDYVNDFATYPGDLWSEGEGALADGPSGTSSAWATDGFANDGFSGAARVNVYHSSFSGGNNDWLISPVFDLSVGSYYLNLDAAATEYGSSTLDAVWGSEDYTALMISEDAGQTWTELYRWDATNSPGLAGAAMPEVDLSVYTGLATFALYAESFDSVEDVDFFVDNFSIGSTSLSLNDVSTVSNFTFFPNPVNNVLTIKAQASIDSITVYNMLGQTVVRSTPNTNDSTVDMSLLQSGAYFVQVSINNTLKTVRVIKN